MRSIESRQWNTANDRSSRELRSIESRSLEIAQQMGNVIDRVVVTGGMRSIESRSVESNWKWEMKSIESWSPRVAVRGNCTAECRLQMGNEFIR